MALLSLLSGGCAAHRRIGTIQRESSPVTRLTGGAPTRVAVIVMENEEYGDVLGSSDAPFENRLARSYGLAASLYAVRHPSLPNYLALTGGSTFGIDSDCTDCSVRATSLVDQLDGARVTWKAYMEDLPRPCYTGSGSRDYAKKHNPFLYYTRVVGDPARCARIVPLAQLHRDEQTGALPRFIWITPNLCHDTHDCSVASGDRFLAGLIPALLARLGRRGLLILIWDEGSSDDGCCRLASGGHVPAIFAGSAVRRGAVMRAPADLYSVLQAIEDLLGLPRLRSAACACTPSLQVLLR